MLLFCEGVIYIGYNVHFYHFNTVDHFLPIIYPFDHFQKHLTKYLLAIFMLTDEYILLSGWYGVIKMYWLPPRVRKNLVTICEQDSVDPLIRKIFFPSFLILGTKVTFAVLLYPNIFSHISPSAKKCTVCILTN